MTRYIFGGTSADFVFVVGPGNSVRTSGQSLTFWDSQSGGTRYTDLLVAGDVVSAVSVPRDGLIPVFSGPDGVKTMWADSGKSTRILMVSAQTIVEASTAADRAEAAAELAESVTAPLVAPANEQVASYVATDGATKTALTASIEAEAALPKLHHLDAYNKLIGDPSYVWQAGQGNTSTTTSAAAASAATTVQVSSVTGLSAGVVIVLNAGTAQQQFRKIASVAGTTLTLDVPLTYAVASGAAVWPLWTDDRHLTAGGYIAWARWITYAQSQSDYIIEGTAPKVTFLGNSWIVYAGSLLDDQVHARVPGATVVRAGVAGNTSAQLLARFDTDVPADSDYVIVNEPGVNDDANNVSAVQQAANLEALWRKCRTIGASLIFTGHVPLQPAPTVSAARAAQATSTIGDGSSFPSLTPAGIGALVAAPITRPNANSLGVGVGALGAEPSGATNVGVGFNAGLKLATGASNAILGYAALADCVSGSNNVAIGSLVLRIATGSFNTVIGGGAAQTLTSGAGNLILGYLAGYNVAGSTADATTDKTNQVILGRQAGGNASNIVAAGYYAKASAEGAIALGANTVAAYSGSAAIGRDNTGAGAASAASNEIALGTALHTTRIRGYLQVDRGQTTVGAAGAAAALPATPTKYLSMKDSTGTEYVIPAYAKA